MAEPVVGTERRTVEAPLPAVRPPRRRPWLALAVLLLVAAAIGAALWFHPWRQDEPQHAGRGGEPPQTVRAVAVEKGELPVDLDALGTVTPLATVTVKPQVAGQLVQIGFREGQDVKPGDFLAQIDPRPYQIALEQAQATLAKDQALLAERASRPRALPDGWRGRTRSRGSRSTRSRRWCASTRRRADRPGADRRRASSI